MANILIVDDERSMREFLEILLEQEGYDVVVADTVQKAKSMCIQYKPDLMFVDLKLPDGSGMDVLQFSKDQDPDGQIIMMTAFATTETAVAAMRMGAYDYQNKPFQVDEIRVLTQKALEKKSLIKENRELKTRLWGQSGLKRILFQSQAMAQVVDLLTKVAPTKTNILIEGESGTGKELIARALHDASPRAQGPFVAVNCGAIPENLMESELFGHAAGAFTGATRSRTGLFQEAQLGTLMLDEVGELSMAMQVKLLRVLEERRVRRIGEEKERPIDVRILAATNQDLQLLVQQGNFREDLFYRLNVVRIHVPALRDRREDIPLLTKFFIMKYARDMGRPIENIDEAAMQALTSYAFPGNVRELENLIERAVALCGGHCLKLQDLPEEVGGRNMQSTSDLLAFPESGVMLEETLQNIERQFLEAALIKTNGVKKDAAKLLGLSFRSFRYRLSKLGFETEEDMLAEIDDEETH